jgi:hypothetical protein
VLIWAINRLVYVSSRLSMSLAGSLGHHTVGESDLDSNGRESITSVDDAKGKQICDHRLGSWAQSCGASAEEASKHMHHHMRRDHWAHKRLEEFLQGRCTHTLHPQTPT